MGRSRIKHDHTLPKGNQPWILFGRTDAEAELQYFGHLMQSRLLGKDPDAGKGWRQEKGMTEDEIGGWHHQLNRHEFEHTAGDSEGQGSLVCCSPWGRRDSDMTEWPNNNETPFLILDISYLLTSESSESFTVGEGLYHISGHMEPTVNQTWFYSDLCKAILYLRRGFFVCFFFFKLKNRTLYLSFLYFAILLAWPKSLFGFFCAVI